VKEIENCLAAKWPTQHSGMVLKVFLALISVVTMATGSNLLPDVNFKQLITSKKGIVVFYNVYAGGNHYDNIVQTQLKTVKGSGLLDQLDRVFYTTSGEHGRDYNIGNSSKYIHIAHYEGLNGELHTLNLLHHFCHANPASKVLYFHDKGSYHYNDENQEFVKLLNCYVLNTHCIEALDDHDTCGWRISPIPVPHYSGNFWWARCSYINTLINPMAQVNNQTFIEKAPNLNPCVGLTNRFFAEFWIGTGPKFLPADCMNATVDTSYVYSYTFPKVAYSHCHGPDRPSGLICQTASTYKDAHLFRETISTMSLQHENPICRDNYDEVIKSTQLMYGQKPHTYMEWMGRIYPKINLTENTVIRFHNSPQVFIVRDGVLRSVPNLKTFLTLGKDFSEVKVFLSTQRRAFAFGEALPSA